MRYVIPKIKSRDENEYLARYKTKLAEAIRARQPHMSRWLFNRRARNCQFDTSKKKEWQSKAYTPKIPEMIEARKRSVERVYDDAPFKCIFKPGVPGNEMLVQMAEFATRQVDYIYYREKVGELIQPLVEDMLTTGICALKISTRGGGEIDVAERDFNGLGKSPKPRFQYNESEYICIEKILPEDILIDPSGAGFTIHRSYMSKDDLLKWANEDRTISKAAIREVVLSKKPRIDSVVEQLRTVDRGYYYPENDENLVVVDEYWGDMYSADGECMMRNGFFVVANESAIIRKPTENPYWHGQCPIIVGKLNPGGRSVYPNDAIQFYLPLWMQMNRTLNQIFDKMALSTPIAIARPDYLMPASDIANGVAPGTTYLLRRSAPPDGKALDFLNPNVTPYNDLALLERIKMDIAGFDGGENALQQPTTRRMTKAEFQGRAALAMEDADGLIRSFDKSVLSPLAEQVWMLFVERMPELVNYNTVNIITEVSQSKAAVEALRWAAMDDEVRWKLFAKSNIACRVGALIEVLKMQADAQRIDKFAAMWLKYPPAEAELDVNAMMRSQFRGSGGDPDTIMLTPEKKQAKQEERMAQAAQMAQMQQAQQPQMQAPEGIVPPMAAGGR